MATTLKLRTDIKKLKGALSSKSLPAPIKAKLKAQLDKAQNELKAMQSGAKPRKVSTTKGTQTALTSLQKLVNKKKFSVYQGKGIDLKKDADQGALAVGRRVSKGIKGNQFGDAKSSKGNVYYEYRANRLDVKQPKKAQKYPKLEDGGMIFKKGDKVILKDGGGEKIAIIVQDGFDKRNRVRVRPNGFPMDISVPMGESYSDDKRVYVIKKMEHGGKTQGYDDKEDERLGMKDGKMSSKDLNSTHSRRDDARFEERMANGGMMAKGGENINEFQKYVQDASKIAFAGGGNGVNITDYGLLEVAMYIDQEQYSRETRNLFKKLVISMVNDEIDNNQVGANDYKNGGVTEKEVVESNNEMVLSQIKAVKHHADELSNIVNKKSDIEAWVVAKIERASTDLSDITHYLDGQHEKMSMGGSINNYVHKMDKK
jgi:hypothetical protein